MECRKVQNTCSPRCTQFPFPVCSTASSTKFKILSSLHTSYGASKGPKYVPHAVLNFRFWFALPLEPPSLNSFLLYTLLMEHRKVQNTCSRRRTQFPFPVCSTPSATKFKFLSSLHACYGMSKGPKYMFPTSLPRLFFYRSSQHLRTFPPKSTLPPSHVFFLLSLPTFEDISSQIDS